MKLEESLKKISNVFINTTGNNITPVNIYYNDKVRKIEKLINEEYAWEDIDSLSKKEKLIKNRKLRSKQIDQNDIDGDFNLIIPGAIDPHVHFNTPGFEFRDDFKHASTAAAYGGNTTIIDMPCTSLPPVTNLKNFNKKLSAVKNNSLVDFCFWGGVSGNEFESSEYLEKNINDLSEAGVASFKTYLISGMDSFKDLTIEQMKLAASLIKKTNKPLGVHAENKKMIEEVRCVHKENGNNEWIHYCDARSSEAEEKAIKDVIHIAEETGVHAHIVHLSSKYGLDAIMNAKDNGINITSETCPQYLHFTQKDFKNKSIRNYLKTAPPIKKEVDRIALWGGLYDGTLSFVTTDHAGCNPMVEKTSENFWEVYGGIPGVEHRVQYLISEGFINNKLSLEKTINLLSSSAADMFRLKQKGRIKEYYDADFALIDLWKNERLKSNNMHSKGKYTPFENLKVNCSVEKTILRGKIIMDKAKRCDAQIGYGNFIEVT